MPDLPSLATQVRGLSLPASLTRAIEELQQFLRVRGGLLPGDGLDAYISRRDLVQWGFATSDLAVGGTPGPGTGPIVPVPVTGNEPDYTPPPVPAGVTALGGYTSVFVKWTPVVDRRIGYFEVWRAAVDDVGQAVKIGQTTSFLYIDEVQNSDSFFYWVRSVNAWDDEVTSAFNAVAGTAAQTAPDVGYAIEVLTGALGEQPFFEITEPTTIGGIVFAPGVYIKDLFVKKAIAEVFVAGLAVIDDASIKNVTAGKILADKLGVGQYIESQGYIAGSSGWRISANGTAEFQTAVVRGTVYASAGAIAGVQIFGSYLQSSNYVAGANGYRLNADGTAEFGNLTARGNIQARTVEAGISVQSPSLFGGSYGSSYAWPTSGGGFHLSASGLLLGNANGGQRGYVQITSDGRFFAPGFSLQDGNISIGGNAVVRGDVQATSLNANSANIVNTLHVAGNAITVPNGAKLNAGSDGWGAYVYLDDLLAGKPVLLWAGCGSTPDGFNDRTIDVYYYNGSSYVLIESVPRSRIPPITGDNINTNGLTHPASVFAVFWPPSNGQWMLRVNCGGSPYGSTPTFISAIQGKR